MRLNSTQIEALKKNIQNGYVKETEHPTLPLKIFNYTPKAQFENEWNPITRMCRGLVLDDDYNIIIKCPEKFFNVGEPLAAKVDLLNARITEKNDGYYISIKLDPDYGLIVTSRGSFSNQYVDAAKAFITDSVLLGLGKNTYFCELCQDFAGDEAIILTKHPIPRLVCWGVKDENHHEFFPDEECPFERTRVMSFVEAKSYLESKVEGVVAQDPLTFERVKLKTDWYLTHHRILADCTKKRVWELLSQGQTVENLDIPDEFMKQMQEWQTELRLAYELEITRVGKLCERTEHLADKELALSDRFTPETKSMMFAVRKKGEQAVAPLIWKKLKTWYN